jgi:hypothetical protein
MLTDSELEVNPERKPRYYEELGRAHDDLLRCKDCQALLTFETIAKMGCCDKCGNKRMIEVTILNEQEMADIKAGVIDFADRDKFLAEFEAVA